MRALAIVAGALALAGCARPGERKAEGALKELLPQYLGPAQSYSTRVKSASLGALMRGRMRTIHIEGKQVKLTPELTVAELTVDAEEVEVDTRDKSLKGVGKARFAARIEEGPLDTMARARRPKLLDLKLALRGQALQVTLRPEVFGYPTVPLTIEGTLVPRRGGQTMDFEPDRARLLIVPIPEPLLDFVAERLNPVIDLAGVGAPIRVESATVRGGALHLTGDVPPDAIVRWSKSAR